MLRYCLMIIIVALVLPQWAAPIRANEPTGLPSIEVGKPFPDLVFPSLEDRTPKRISDFRGKRVLLHVFASW